MEIFGNRQRELIFGIAIVGGSATGVASFRDAIAGVDELIDLGGMCGVATVVAGINRDDFSGERKIGDRCCG